jgi:hypothetical protein
MAMGPWHDLHDLLHGRLTELKKENAKYQKDASPIPVKKSSAGSN